MEEEYLIFEDEPLDEIEIREYVTLEQMLLDNPRFVAFTEDELYIHFNSLFGNNNKTKGFVKLHKSIIDYKPYPLSSTYTLPKLDIFRGDYEDIDDYFEARDRAKNSTNYSIQRQKYIELSLPYVWEKDTNEFSFVPQEGIIFDLNNTIKHDQGKLLDFDNKENISFIGSRWVVPKYTSENYLSEEYSDDLKYKLINWNNDSLLNYDDWVKKYVLPSLSQVITKTIKYITDLHELKALLFRYSYIFDDLTDDQLDILVRHLESIIENVDDRKNKENQNSHKYHAYALKNIDYWEAIKENNKRLLPLTKEENKKIVEERVANYITSIKNTDKLEIKEPIVPYKLAQKIEANELSINDVSKIIKSKITEVHQLLAEKLFINITAFNVPDEESIVKEKNLYKLIDKSIINNDKTVFITKWVDLSEIKVGNDTSKYDGSPLNNLNTIFEETSKTYLKISDAVGDQEDIDVRIADTDEELNSDINIPDDIRGVYEKIIKIKNISGLPLEIEDLYEQHKDYINQRSRFDKIKTLLPEIPDIIIKRICSYKLEDAIEYIKDLANIKISEELQKIYPPIFNDWKKDSKQNLKVALTIWWLNLLESSINKQLNFSILRGVIEYINNWSPYGPPVEDTKEHGILQYLSAVASDVSGISIDTLRKDMSHIATNLFQGKIDLLKEKWASSKRPKDKSKKIRDIIAETIRAIKAKESVNVLGNFVESYIYLPTLLPNAKIKKLGTWGYGCCLLIIGNQYSADIDWKDELKPLWRLKELLAKDRWLTIKRPTYRRFIPNIDSEKETSKDNVVVKPDIKITEDDKYKLLPNDYWLSSAQISKLTEDYDGSLYATTFLNNTIDRLYGNLSTKKKDAITKAINDNKSELNILNIISYVATNLQQNRQQESVMEIIKSIKDVLSKIKNTSHPIYIYALACVLALPGKVNNIFNFILPSNISSTVMETIANNNYNYIIEYAKSNSMMTVTEIQNYITKMREIEKNIKLEYQDELSNDDRRLLKDMKRFGLKVDMSDANNMNNPTQNEDDQGEADFMQMNTDYDRDDDEL